MIRHLIKLFSVLFVLSFGQSAWANCTVNGVNYKTNGGSGTAITTAIIKNRASSWNNATDLITTCDVSSIINMTDMFRGNGAINQNLSDWDTSSVTDMRYMFSGASTINSVSFPNTSAVTNMKRMFDGASLVHFIQIEFCVLNCVLFIP